MSVEFLLDGSEREAVNLTRLKDHRYDTIVRYASHHGIVINEDAAIEYHEESGLVRVKTKPDLDVVRSATGEAGIGKAG